MKKSPILLPLAAASLLLIGCSNPQSDFVKHCVNNDYGTQSDCECIVERLDKALTKSDFKKLNQALAKGHAEELALIDEVGEHLYLQLVGAAKACSF